ncbi:MAG: protein kinase [Sandaracinus sp.]
MSPAAETDPWVGRILSERYRIERRLGKGGMGAVYEAEHLLLKRRVALKVLLPQHAEDAEVVARFRREALAATHIGHEHIVEVHDMGRADGGTLFLVLEMLEGKDLARALDDEGPFPIARAIHVMDQLCDGLAAAHAKGIVHRDLKPENVFLIPRKGDPDFVKILDFGISKFQDGVLGEEGKMTQTGVPMGTAYYMAPEQAMGRRDLDHRADVYALGVILFRLLTADYPFDSETFAGLVVKLVTETAPRVRPRRPDVPEALDAAIARCLEKEPAARFPTVEALREALAPFARLEGGAPPRPARSAVVVGSGSHDTALSATATPAAHAVPATLPSRRPLARPVTAVEATPTRPSGGGNALAWVFGGAGIVATAVLALVLVNGGLGARDAPASTTAPAPVDGVHLTVTSVPSDATLFLDGERIANPFDGLVERREGLREVRAEREGYESYRAEIAITMPQTLHIDLERAAASEAPPATSESATPRGRHPGRPIASTAAPSEASPTSEAPRATTVPPPTPAVEATPPPTEPEAPPATRAVLPEHTGVRSGGLFGHP